MEVDASKIQTLSSRRIVNLITKINNLDLRYLQETSLTGLFSGMENLLEISFKTSNNITALSSLFSNCSKLKKVDFSGVKSENVTTMQRMFEYCYDLEDITPLNTSGLDSMTNAFTSCSKLTEQSLNNILLMCANARVYGALKQLNTLGLTSAQATTCTGLSNWSAAQAAGWSTGY